MDISSLYNVSSGVIREAANNSATTKSTDTDSDMFGAIFNSAVDNLKTTNGYIADAKSEEVKLAMGETDNTHDLSVALQKMSTSLQYTVAVRDKFIEAYKEIMQMQT